MKQAVLTIIMGLIVIIMVYIIMSSNIRTQRSQEGEEALASAVETTVQTLLNEKTYTVENNEEFAGDLLQALAMQLNSVSKIKVKVLSADAERGMMSIEVTGEYVKVGKKGTSRPGNTTTVSCKRNIIFDTKEPEDETIHIIKLYYSNELTDDNLYRTIQVRNDDAFKEPPAPADPTGSGKDFKGWRKPGGSIQTTIAAETIAEDATYYAVFN